MDSKKIGSFICERRKALGMTQLELSNKLNITDRAISKWENGMCMPETEKLIQLSDIFTVSTDYILGLKDE